MAENQKAPPSGGSAGSAVFNLLHIVFSLVGVVMIIAGFGVLLYQIWLFVSGQGWHNILFGAVLDYVLGPPQGELSLAGKALAISALAPLPILLVAVGWIFSKIGDLCEKRA